MPAEHVVAVFEDKLNLLRTGGFAVIALQTETEPQTFRTAVGVGRESHSGYAITFGDGTFASIGVRHAGIEREFHGGMDSLSSCASSRAAQRCSPKTMKLIKVHTNSAKNLDIHTPRMRRPNLSLINYFEWRSC